jgi:putative nucleotidyltransferase with HDIG domain
MAPAAASTQSGLRAYVAAVAAVGCALFAYSAAVAAAHRLPVEWLVLAGLTFLSGRIELKVPSLDARFTVSEVFAFTSVLLFGPEAGAVTLALDSLVLAWHRRMPADKACFNFANLTLATWSSGTLFFLVTGVEPLFGNGNRAGELILPLGLLAACYFLVNTGLVAVAFGLQANASPLVIWRKHFMRLAPGYAANASLALLLVVALQHLHFAAIAVLPPLLLIFYYTLQSSFGRIEDAQGHLAKLNTLYLSTVETLATAIDAKDEVTHGHIRRVQLATVALARELGVKDEQTIRAIEAAALLHDTGKIAIPEHILNKPGKLTPAEYDKMKLHAPIGAEILSAIDFPYPVVPIVRHHHENWDGSGYPDRISGTDIPLGARILSVVDCFDALTSDRPYRKRMTDEAALRILHERRGTMYDPLVVDVFSAKYKEIMPAEEAAHPAARVVGEARDAGTRESAEAMPHDPARDSNRDASGITAGPEGSALNEVLAVSSLARALAGHASLSDVGALLWMTLRHALPATSMVLFVDDEAQDLMTVAHAAGAHAPMLRQLKKARGGGIAGWVAVNRRGVLNAEPALDVGSHAAALEPSLRSSLTVPLTHDGRLVGVLSCYASAPQAFSEDDLRLLEVLAASLAAAIAAVDDVRTASAKQPVPPRRGNVLTFAS